MKVAIKITSTQDANQYRGIGFYTQNLVNNLKNLEDKNFQLLTFDKQIPTADLYHFPDFSPFFFSFPFNLINKSVITIHDLIPIEFGNHYPAGIKGSLRWQVQKFLLKKAAHIITDSIASQKSICHILNLPKSKVTPIYLGPGNSNLAKLEKPAFNLPETFLLYVGDINWNKNIMILAQSCIDLNIPLLVIGKQAANRNIDKAHPWNQPLVEFQNFAKQNSNLIKCLGYVKTSQLNFLYHHALAYVCPSIAEGFGLPILEAMTNECPVISSNLASLPEIGGKACLYFHPYKKEELISQIKRLIDDKKLRVQLIEQGQNQAQKFSWQKTAQQTLNIYQKVYAK